MDSRPTPSSHVETLDMAVRLHSRNVFTHPRSRCTFTDESTHCLTEVCKSLGFPTRVFYIEAKVFLQTALGDS
ncbi:hypothetical protein GCM10011359_28860 [Nesterenkonia alkaliphila]|nr:hypothetical protein GCM10011359_28860 [Nesterenkonia alkaliphila]